MRAAPGSRSRPGPRRPLASDTAWPYESVDESAGIPFIDSYRPFFDPMRTVSDQRPRRRRRFNVARPAFVLIRERNPCLLRRLRLRGLYVGFISFSTSS